MQGCGLSVLAAPVDAKIVPPVHHFFYLLHPLVDVHHVMLVGKTGASHVESSHRFSIAHSEANVIIAGRPPKKLQNIDSSLNYFSEPPALSRHIFSAPTGFLRSALPVFRGFIPPGPAPLRNRPSGRPLHPGL